MKEKQKIVKSSESLVPVEIIQSKIFIIRGRKVMFDRDLAELYGVETRRLNEQVKRNVKRFPPDFMHQLTKEETKNWMSQIAISNKEKMGIRRMPYVFTEQGVAMLSSVLNSDRAIEVNIQIMRVFVRLKELMISHKDLARKIENLERKFKEHDQKFVLVFEAIKQLLEEPEEPSKPKEPIGFFMRK